MRSEPWLKPKGAMARPSLLLFIAVSYTFCELCTITALATFLIEREERLRPNGRDVCPIATEREGRCIPLSPVSDGGAPSLLVRGSWVFVDTARQAHGLEQFSDDVVDRVKGAGLGVCYLKLDASLFSCFGAFHSSSVSFVSSRLHHSICGVRSSRLMGKAMSPTGTLRQTSRMMRSTPFEPRVPKAFAAVECKRSASCRSFSKCFSSCRWNCGDCAAFVDLLL